jgi:signal transduction histidine kinase
MPLVAYENTYINQEKSTTLMLLPSPEASKKEDCAGSGTMNKTIHDFRSSLNIIIGYTELMLDDVMGRMTQEQRDSLKDILTSSQRMMELVNEISFRQTPART